MIAFFPEIYPDELLYSQLARYHARSGNIRYIFTAEELYRHKTVHPDVEFINAYSEDALRCICKQKPFEQVIEQHTMYPAYARFLPYERRQKAFDHLMQREGVWSNDMAIPNSGKRYLRYCPLCAAEDREQFGETYWHRSHQIQRVQVCPKHRCYLEDSSLLLSGKTSPDLYDAERAVPLEQNAVVCDNNRLLSFTDYVIQVMQQPVVRDNTVSVGYYLNTKLPDLYRSASGVVRQITLLSKRLERFYDGFNHRMTTEQIQKVFNGYLYDIYFICQIGFFLGVSVQELTCLPASTERSGFDLFLKKLSAETGVEENKVKKICEAVLKYDRMQQTVHSPSGKRKRTWDELDNKLLPQVVAAVNQMYCATDRPKKVSAAAVQKALGMPQKQLDNLPQCKAYVEQHRETQTEYWAREVTWAIRHVEERGVDLKWKRIREITNMKPDDLRACIPCILDNTVKEKAKQIAAYLK